jgi:hypothetical protein
MNRPLLERALAALENSLDDVSQAYYQHWGHGIPTRQKQLDGIRGLLEEHQAVIKAIREELGKPPPIECGMLGWNQGKVYMAYNNVALDDGYYVLYAVKSSD